MTHLHLSLYLFLPLILIICKLGPRVALPNLIPNLAIRLPLIIPIQNPLLIKLLLSDRLVCNETHVYVSSPRFPLSFFFFFFFQPTIVDFVNCEQCICVLFTVPQITFLTTFLLKMGPTTLFTYLKIISLQCFQFQFSVSAKISSIQTHPKCVIYY